MTPTAIANLNAGGAAQILDAARDVVIACLHEEALRTPHWAAGFYAETLAQGRATAARLIGAVSPAHIAFGQTATCLWASAFAAQTLKPGDRVIVGRGEWGGNIANARQHALRCGATLEIAPCDAAGRIDTAALAVMIDDRVAAICVPVVSSALGVVQDVAAIGALPRPDHCLFFVDAAQAAGRMVIDLGACHADIMTMPSRKWLRGPRGQAVMALSDRALVRLGAPPIVDLAGLISPDDATRFESFEYSVADRLGFCAALRHAERHIGPQSHQIDRMMTGLRDAMLALPSVRVIETTDAPAFLTFSLEGEAPEATVARLRDANIAIAAVQAVYAPFEYDARSISSICRVSPHVYTTEEDCWRFLHGLESRCLHNHARA